MIYIKLKNCCFFFFEVYFEAPKMYTNQLNNIYNGVHFFVCSFTKNMLLYKYFSRFLLRFVLQLSVKGFQNFTYLCFPENLLLAATNRFKVLKIFISLTIYINIQQNMAKHFTLHSADAHSEPCPTSKQGGYLIGGNYFHKISAS